MHKIAIALIALVVILLISAVLMLPALSGIIENYLISGVDLKGAAVLSFFVTVVIMIVFAIASD